MSEDPYPGDDAVRGVLCPALGLAPQRSRPDLLEETVAFFVAIPWCASLLDAGAASDTPVVPLITQCRNPAGADDEMFFSQTLGSERTLQHMLCFFRPDDAQHARDSARPISRVSTLYAFGEGVCGFPGMMHGGVVMALADEAMGVLTELNWSLGKEGAAFAGGSVTGTLTTDFIRPVSAPGVVCAEAWIDGVRGRKTMTRCEIRDELGTVLVRCSSTWVAIKSNL